ncbi:hypothetical protein PM082_020022 [Marasmius tenuissimus]|nr:hypothetical protein PM082_020022 [Marasmius tenuissimus]
MVEYGHQNPQLANRLSAVKCAGNREPSFGQQQCPQQQHQQRGQQQHGQQRQPQQQQQCPSSNQNNSKKKQQCGTHSGVNQHQGPSNVGGNNSGNNRSHGHSNLASYASVIASPASFRHYSSITDCRECIALNTVNNSLRTEIASAPPVHAMGSLPPAHFTGHWDKSCDSTVPQPAVKKDPAAMQSFTSFKPSQLVFDDVCEAHSLADRLGAPKTVQYLKPFEHIVTSAANCSLQDRIEQSCVSLSKCVLEDDEGYEGAGSPSSTSSKRSHSTDPDEDVEMDWGSDDSMEDIVTDFLSLHLISLYLICAMWLSYPSIQYNILSVDI